MIVFVLFFYEHLTVCDFAGFAHALLKHFQPDWKKLNDQEKATTFSVRLASKVLAYYNEDRTKIV